MPKAPKLSEHQIQTQILDYLERRNIFHYRANTGVARIKGSFVRFGVPGQPDIIAVLKGRYLGIEVKRPGEKLRPEQEEFRRRLTDAGGLHLTVTSVEEVEKGIEEEKVLR